MENQSNKFGLLYRIFGILGVLLIVAVYFLPLWWVALQSHQYPKSMYPKGIRIEFKFNGVYNGCEGVQERAEITTNEGAECLVEMNAINHYIGMFPIVRGANSRVYKDHKGAEREVVPEYWVFDTVKDAEGEDIIDPVTGKAKEINVTPSYLNTLNWILVNSKYILGILVLMGLFFVFYSKKVYSIFGWLPAFLPFYFLGLYMFSMYWYGHHLDLHGGGAFAGIKPFMPTIFGHGKVAQFETVAYPYFGFLVAMLVFIVFIFAILFKKKYLKLQKEN